MQLYTGVKPTPPRTMVKGTIIAMRTLQTKTRGKYKLRLPFLRMDQGFLTLVHCVVNSKGALVAEVEEDENEDFNEDDVVKKLFDHAPSNLYLIS